ncbi:MAG: hypothetical protein ACO3RG_06530, partial [Nitriliruptoraceae bacterium]
MRPVPLGPARRRPPVRLLRVHARRRVARPARLGAAAPLSAAPVAPVALVPLRVGGKSRLSSALDDDARRRLVLAMLDDVVAALRGGGVDDVRILAGDAAAAPAAPPRGQPPVPRFAATAIDLLGVGPQGGGPCRRRIGCRGRLEQCSGQRGLDGRRRGRHPPHRRRNDQRA